MRRQTLQKFHSQGDCDFRQLPYLAATAVFVALRSSKPNTGGSQICFNFCTAAPQFRLPYYSSHVSCGVHTQNLLDADNVTRITSWNFQPRNTGLSILWELIAPGGNGGKAHAWRGCHSRPRPGASPPSPYPAALCVRMDTLQSIREFCCGRRQHIRLGGRHVCCHPARQLFSQRRLTGVNGPLAGQVFQFHSAPAT